MVVVDAVFLCDFGGVDSLRFCSVRERERILGRLAAVISSSSGGCGECDSGIAVNGTEE